MSLVQIKIFCTSPVLLWKLSYVDNMKLGWDFFLFKHLKHLLKGLIFRASLFPSIFKVFIITVNVPFKLSKILKKQKKQNKKQSKTS